MKILRHLRTGAIALMVVASLEMHLGAVETPGQLKADELVKTLLLPESQHIFIHVDLNWQIRITYQKLRPDAFVQVDHPSNKEKKILYKMIQYSVISGPNAPDTIIKQIIYRPSGELYREVDFAKEEEFCRRFFEDGSLREYTYLQKGKLLAGVAVDPASKKPNFISNGSGSLTTYGEHSGDFKTERYQDGNLFLSSQYTNSIRTEIDLCSNSDSLRATSNNELLLLNSEYEYWTCPVGTDPSVQIIDYTCDATGKMVRNIFPPKTDIRSLPLHLSFGGPQARIDSELKEWEKTEAQIRAEWKAAYPKRRKVFLDAFEKILNTSGQTWKSLDIEFIRDDAPWPKN